MIYLFLFIGKRITTFGENLVKVVLKPSDIWAEAGKLPYPIDLLVPVCVGAVRVALDRDRLQGGVGVFLVRYA